MAASSRPSTSTSGETNVENLTDLAAIEAALAGLDDEEGSISRDLDSLLDQQILLETKMSSLQKTLPNLQLIHKDSKQLSGMILHTSDLAENVSSKVRELDLAKSRVTSAMQMVEDVLDLKFCTDGVQSALQNEDYEQAAAHIHRFLSLDENVLRMTEGVGEGSQLEASFLLLHEAELRLKNIVHKQFDASVHTGDVASVERFFKIFPLINLHDDGLTKFSKYLCTQISESADKNLKLATQSGASDKRSSVMFSDTLTLLFESIARVVETHQPLVETYYGHGRMFTMMQHIQKECDRQTRRIISDFKQNRNFDAKVQQVQRNLYNKPGAERIEPKIVDVLLTEVTLLNTRSELYLRFARRRCQNDFEVANPDADALKEKMAEVDRFLLHCDLSRLMQELIGSYIQMEEYFMREMVVKAVNMDVHDPGSLTSSMVDDAFFIVKKCVRRAMSSSSVDGVCAMLNHACNVLETDYRDVLLQRLKSGFPSGFDFSQAYNLVQSSIQQGKLQSSDTEKAKTIFLTTLNNVEVSCENVKTLRVNLEDEINKLYGGPGVAQSKAKLDTCLGNLGNVVEQMKDVQTFGFDQLHMSAIKPRIKPWIDAFTSVSHNIDEDEFANFEANDPWVQTFIMNLDGLLSTFRETMTPSNYEILITRMTNEATMRLEKAVLKSTFNRLGGLQFDKELRSLVGYLTSVTTWTIRDKFARLTQMGTILNLERVGEILDYWGSNSGPLTWRLTPAEVRQVLALRGDFRSEDIKRLKL